MVDYGEKSNYQINQESPLKFEIKISNEGGEDVETRIGVFLINEDQICITSAISDINLDAGYINLNEGDNTIRLLFKNHHLMPGRYNLRIWIKSALHERLIDFTTDSVFIEVNNSLLANYPELSMGSIYLPFQYSKVEN